MEVEGVWQRGLPGNISWDWDEDVKSLYQYLYWKDASALGFAIATADNLNEYTVVSLVQVHLLRSRHEFLLHLDECICRGVI